MKEAADKKVIKSGVSSILINWTKMLPPHFKFQQNELKELNIFSYINKKKNEYKGVDEPRSEIE